MTASPQALTGAPAGPRPPRLTPKAIELCRELITGKRSRSRIRPMHPAWAEQILADRAAVGTPAFFKVLCTNDLQIGGRHA